MAAEHLKMFQAMQGLAAENEPALLATVVRVSGSAYRSLGARMLILPNGQRIGSVSGGCIEGEIAKKAWWWTEGGRAYLRRYDTSLEGDESGYGLACNGSIDVLVERISAGDVYSPLALLETIYRRRVQGVIASVFEVEADGKVSIRGRVVLAEDGTIRGDLSCDARSVVLPLMRVAMLDGVSSRMAIDIEESPCEVTLEFVQPPPQLVVCGAGFDAVPLVRFAADLGWRVLVCDGRADLAKPQRFPEANRVFALGLISDLKSIQDDGRTACVIMTHSYEQDHALLSYWLPRGLRYLGILGARSRTREMLDQMDVPFDAASVYAPAGLDIGSETPEEIALSIVAEIRACFANRGGGSLRDRSGSIHLRIEQAQAETTVAS
jgi:xanthine dehydrogenase accessory factor